MSKHADEWTEMEEGVREAKKVKKPARPWRTHKETGIITEARYYEQLHAEHGPKLLAKKGGVQNDALDLQPLTLVSAPELHNMTDTINELRSLKLNKLEELYPTASNTCQNNGQLQWQTQMIYTCQSPLVDDNEVFRVDASTYDQLNAFPELFTCSSSAQNNQVCVCGVDHTDYLCATEAQYKCQVKIIDPPFEVGCPEKEDSAFYTYSLQGFAPCYPLDFSKTIEVKYKLKCMQYDTTASNKVVRDPKPKVGYAYRDVIKHPVYDE